MATDPQMDLGHGASAWLWLDHLDLDYFSHWWTTIDFISPWLDVKPWVCGNGWWQGVVFEVMLFC